MKKELPGIFKKEVASHHSNNKKVFYANNNVSSDRSNKTEEITNDSLTTVEEKIRKLFKSSRYIFNINVLIKTNKKDYNTKIAGKVKNSIVTTDGEVIPIIDINDIIIKDRI
jgi:hypothetical protein